MLRVWKSMIRPLDQLQVLLVVTALLQHLIYLTCVRMRAGRGELTILLLRDIPVSWVWEAQTKPLSIILATSTFSVLIICQTWSVIIIRAAMGTTAFRSRTRPVQLGIR